MLELGFPYLSLIAYVPLAGALILLLLPKNQPKMIMYTATAVAAIDFVLSVPLFFWYDRSDAGFQFVEKFSWIPSIGVQYFFGVDGITVLLVLLTTVLGLISIYSSYTAVTERVKEYYVFLLLLQTGMLGVFMALDFFLFYVFWEVMLVPMYFLIGIWGGPRRLYAAIKFFLYTLLGSVLMLLGILAIYFYYPLAFPGAERTFDVTLLHQLGALTDPAWLDMQWWVFLAFFVGFAIKVPMFPFHTWLPDAHVQAPTAGSVILAGVLLKMGTYGFIRFSLPILPQAAQDSMWWLLGLCVIGVIYGAMVAMVQKDWKSLVAYSSVSHLGFTMLGVFALNHIGMTGGVLQMLNHGISTGALFLLVGIVYEQRHTRMISEYGGLSKLVPVFAIFFMIMTMSSIGLPTLNGFIGEFTILAGVWNVPADVGFTVPLLGMFFGGRAWAIASVFGIVLGAAYMLWLYQRTMFGKVDNPKNESLRDMNFREIMTLVPLVVLAFWIGLYPKPFFDILEKPVDKVVRQVHGDWYDEDGLARDVAVEAEPVARHADADDDEAGALAHGTPTIQGVLTTRLSE